MEKPFLLHMITPEKNISPFDANMAFDAGWDSVIPYTNIGMDEIQGIVQDTIFYIFRHWTCLLYTSPSPRDLSTSRMPSSA